MPLKINKPFSIFPWLVSSPIHFNWLKKSLPFFFFFVFGVMSCVGQNQGINNWWLLGYGSYWGMPYGDTKINFYNGNPVFTNDSLEMDFQRTAANISDTAGNLLFYTNGYYVADATNDTMQNGSGISPTGFTALAPYGLTVPQACLIVPKPNNPNIYYLLHNTVDNSPYYNKSLKQYVSTIDMSLNGGLGGIINKNTILINDTINPGKITACRHGNGRDWWVIMQRVNSNSFYEFLITPNGISAPIVQNVGNVRTNFLGMAVFSPDGTKYTSFHAEYTKTGELDVYDFDRCTGLLSNPIHIVIPQASSFSCGLAISSSSRYLYTANAFELYQFDLTAANVATSKITVAVWDSFYSPSPPFATGFEIPQLAPDGKIYISTGNSTFHMHVINFPDSSGLSCNVVQHAIQFQYFYANGIPNHPNYFLGRDTGSVCDTITSWLGLNEEPPDKISPIKVFPNPNNGQFTLWFYVHDKPGWIDVYDVNGNLILHEGVAPWSQYKQVNISHQPNGIYFCKMRWGDKEQGVKVIKN